MAANTIVYYSNGTSQGYNIVGELDSRFEGNDTIVRVEIGDTVTTIGTGAFRLCSSITSVVISENVTEIKGYAFSGCKQLTSVNIPSGITNIGTGVFNACSSLTSVVIPNGVTEIGYYAFDYCTSLTSITIPTSVTKIGNWAFEHVPEQGDLYCDEAWYSILAGSQITNLGNVYNWRRHPLSESPSDNDANGDGYDDRDTIVFYTNGTVSAFTFDHYLDNTFRNDPTVAKIILGNTVSETYQFALEACRNLTAITIPDSVVNIDEYTFSTSGLKSIIFPSSINQIKRGVCDTCRSLSAITIPNGVESIEPYAFHQCESLTSATIHPSVNSIGLNAFANVPEQGDLYCDESWYNSLTQEEITNLGNVYNWRRHPLSESPTYNGGGDNPSGGGDNPTNPTGGTDNPPSTGGTDNPPFVDNNGDGYDDGDTIIYYSDGTVSAYTIDGEISEEGAYDEDGNLIAKFSSDNTIIKAVIGTKVTGLYGAFAFCSSLTSVTIPNNTMEEIGGQAFYLCTNLKRLNSDTDGVFNIPLGVKEIGREAFVNALFEALYLNDVERIGDNAFRWMLAGNDWGILKRINSAEDGIADFRNSSVKEFGDRSFAFQRGITRCYLPTINGTVTIDDEAFSRNSIETLEFGENTRYSIGNSAFFDNSLMMVELPSGVTRIGNQAFAEQNTDGDNGLIELVISDNIQTDTIGVYTFNRNFGDYNGYNSVRIPTAITTINYGAFNNAGEQGKLYCDDNWYDNLSDDNITNLGNVYYWKRYHLDGSEHIDGDETGNTSGDTVVYYKDGTVVRYPIVGSLIHTQLTSTSPFYKVEVGTRVTTLSPDTFFDCTDLEILYIPDGITVLPNNALRNCQNLTELRLPSTLKTIEMGAFYETAIPYVELPEGLETIEYQAFTYANGLKSIKIPDSVTDIGSYAFLDCPNLEEVVLGSGTTIIRNGTFEGCPNLTAVTIPPTIQNIMFDAFRDCPTEGVLTCDEDWYNNLTQEEITNLGNVYYWRKKWLNNDDPTQTGTTFPTYDEWDNSYRLRYWSKCVSINEKNIEVGIYLKDYNGQADELLMLDDGIDIEYTTNGDIFKPLKMSSLTVRYLHKTKLDDLYTSKILNVMVLVKYDDELFWVGYMTPNAYNQPYNGWYDQIEIECIDCISALQYFDYDWLLDSKESTIASYAELLEKCLKKVCPRHIRRVKMYESTYINGADDNDAALLTNKILPYTYVQERNFFNEDDKAMKMQEVVEQIMMFYQLTMVQWKDTIYLYDPEYIVNNANAIGFETNLDCLFETPITKDFSSTRIFTKTDNRNAIQVFGDNGNYEFGDVYNKISVVASIMDASQMFNTFDDFISTSEVSTKIIGDYTVLYKDITFDGEGDWWTMNHDKVYWRRFAYYKTKEVPESVNWTTYMGFIGDSAPTPDEPIFTMKGKGVIISPEVNDTYYLVIGGDYLLQTNAKEFPIDVSDTSGYQYAQKICDAELKIGDKYWNGINWTTTKSTFDLDYALSSAKDHQYRLYMGEWRSLTSNVTYTMGIDKKGFAIPIRPTDGVYGTVEFGLHFISTSPRSIAFLKDISLDLCVSDGKYGDGENADLIYENIIDEENVMDFSDISMAINTYNGEVNKTLSYSYAMRKGTRLLPTDTLNPRRYLTTISRSIDFMTDNPTLRPEEVNCLRYARHYSKPKYIWNDTISWLRISPFDSVFIPQLDKNLIMGDATYKLIQDKTDISAFEI